MNRRAFCSLVAIAAPFATANAGIITNAVRNPANGHWYAAVAIQGGIVWADARGAAELDTFNGVSGHLVTLTSAQENQFIVDNLEAACVGMYHIGGFQPYDPTPEADPAADWQWVTGEAWDYTNWMWVSNEPNDSGGGEDVLRLWRSDWWLPEWTGQHPLGMWNDGIIDELVPGYVVEFAPTPGTVAVLGLGLLGFRRRR